MGRDPDRARKKQVVRQPEGKPKAVSWLHQCPDWPIYEVLLSEGWNDEKNLATALVARQSPRSGKVAVASFLVDLACLGVKTSFVRICKSPEDYQRRLLRPMKEEQTLQPAELDLVAKIIAEGVTYAERLGFAPDPEYHQARRLLAGANPDACTVDVQLGGPEGKPHFVSGPYDDAEQIIAVLTRTVGEGNFHYTVFQKENETQMPRLPGFMGLAGEK